MPARRRLPAPEEAEALAVPVDEGAGSHDGECISPVSGASVCRHAGLDLALLVKGELLSQEQILARQRGLWS